MRTLKYLLLVIATVTIVKYASTQPDVNLTAISSIAILSLATVFILMFCTLRGPKGDRGPMGPPGPAGMTGRDCKCHHSISSSDTGGYPR